MRSQRRSFRLAGSGLDRIVKMTVVLADSADYDEMNRVWREFFPVDPPARTTCALPLSNGNGGEIEYIALAGQSPSYTGLGAFGESGGMDLKLRDYWRTVGRKAAPVDPAENHC